MSDDLITTQSEFFRVLAQTAAEVDALVVREPAVPIWVQLQRQLQAMTQWTANGAVPTAEQLQRISIGLIAARELEPASDAVMGDLIARLHLLNYAWRRWPLDG